MDTMHMNTSSQPPCAPEYWLRGTQNEEYLVIFRINYHEGRPVEGVVAMVVLGSFLPVADETKVSGKTFSRLNVYTADELRSLWEILIRSGYWERSPPPMPNGYIDRISDPFS